MMLVMLYRSRNFVLTQRNQKVESHYSPKDKVAHQVNNASCSGTAPMATTDTVVKLKTDTVHQGYNYFLQSLLRLPPHHSYADRFEYRKNVESYYSWAKAFA